MSDYLTKPLEVHRLQQTLEYWLSTSSEWVEAVAEAADGQVGTGPTFTAESPPIDVTAMRELFGVDDMDMFGQFIDKFLHTVGPDIRSLADSLSSNDAEQSRSLAIKSSLLPAPLVHIHWPICVRKSRRLLRKPGLPTLVTTRTLFCSTLKL